jgi:anti-sigma factor (TIGR02949 family)
MDCQSVRALLPYYQRAAEGMDAADRDAVRQHLDACPECGPLAQAESQIDRTLGTAMRAVPVPPDLKGRIHAKLAKQPRPILSWRAAAIAAAVLIAVGLGSYAYIRTQPVTFYPEDTQEIALRQHNSADQVEASFLARGVVMTAPRDFNYDYLKNYHLVDFKGRRVPMLLFSDDRVKNQTVVEVYVLPSDGFRMHQGQEHQEERHAFNTTIREADEAIYVIVELSGNYHHLQLPLQ